MLKFLSILTAVCFCSFAYAQTDTLTFTKEEMRLLDSMFKNDEFIKLMMGKDKNYLYISIGIGNGVFSAHNNAANATGVNKQLVYTPSINYRLKNGLNFGVIGFITGNSTGKPEVYQTGINAGYDYYGKTVTTGIAYTRYLRDGSKYNSKSLYQNDFFGYIKKAKGVIQPGLYLGYASGTYKESRYATFIKTFRLPSGRDTTVVISGHDSTDNKTSYFSATASMEHDFVFYKLFSKNDRLYFTPSLLVNFGSDKLTQVHTNRIFDRPALSDRKKSDFSNKFQAQSIAASFNFTYMVKKFFLQPSLYVDYYLPETTEKRAGVIFSVTTGFSF
ncbi:MAG: hypothetical protein WBP16_11680 [Ferruginibacter sp.]